MKMKDSVGYALGNKLMLLGANISINYRTLLERILYNLEAKYCMLHMYELCPCGRAVGPFHGKWSNVREF